MIRKAMPEGFTLSDFIRSRYSGRVHGLYLIQLGGLAVCSFAVQLLAGGKVISMLTGIPFIWATIALAAIVLAYSAFSGLKASVVTDYEQAIPILQAYLKQRLQGKHASRAGLFLGKAFLGLGRLEEAKAAFRATVRDHPGSLEDHKCRYKLAVVAMLSGETQEAIRLFGELARNPDGPLVAEATVMQKFLLEGPL